MPIVRCGNVDCKHNVKSLDLFNNEEGSYCGKRKISFVANSPVVSGGYYVSCKYYKKENNPTSHEFPQSEKDWKMVEALIKKQVDKMIQKEVWEYLKTALSKKV